MPEADAIVLQPTGQRFALMGPPPAEAGRHTFVVLGFDEAAAGPVRLQWLRVSPQVQPTR